MQLKNIPQKGFACFYGDENSNNLIVYNSLGNQLWHKKIPDAKGFALLTSAEDIYLLNKNEDDMIEGGYSLLGYNIADGAPYDKFSLKDKKGNSLKVLAFENDVNTGKPYISGNIINPDRGNKFYTGKGIAQGAYSGVFTSALLFLKPLPAAGPQAFNLFTWKKLFWDFYKVSIDNRV